MERKIRKSRKPRKRASVTFVPHLIISPVVYIDPTDASSAALDARDHYQSKA